MLRRSKIKRNDGMSTLSQTELRIQQICIAILTLWRLLCSYALFLWDYNPYSVIYRRHRRLYFVENYGEIMIKPKFGERVLDLFLTDDRRRQRLLNWVHVRLGAHVQVFDFSMCWQDGIALCALLESICPGVCPSFSLLPTHNRVKNCRLGMKLASKYLYVPMDLISAEEISIATKTTEPRLIQYISMVKWASENIRDKWSTLHESLIAAKTGSCFAKGAGLKSGIVETKSKFSVFISDTIGVFNLMIEVRGPHYEYCCERIVSLHQAKVIKDKSLDFDDPQMENLRYLEDSVGNSFVRKRVPSRYDFGKLTSEDIFMDVTCGDEGTFYVAFIPKRAGMHTVSVKWQNHHVENSPFRVKVYKASNVSVKTLRGAQERRVLFDAMSFSSQSGDFIDTSTMSTDSDVHGSRLIEQNEHLLTPSLKAKEYKKGRQLTVSRRRVIRKIITRNGENIVIEESISPSLSRQSSFTDNSDEDNKHFRLDLEAKRVARTDRDHLTYPMDVLCTVPEEFRNSKEGETSIPSTDFNQQKQVGDEQKPLDVGNAKQAEIKEQTTHKGEKLAVERLQERASSVGAATKSPARRTKSDGPYIRSRRHSSIGDSDSDMSSDGGIQPNTQEKKGTVGPDTCVLHSESMRKACMYVRQKALSGTSSSGTGGDTGGECHQENGPQSEGCILKTKLRATRSMPLIRKSGRNNEFRKGKVQSLIHWLKDVRVESDVQAVFRDGGVDNAGAQLNAGPQLNAGLRGDEYEQMKPDRQKPVKFQFKQIESMSNMCERQSQSSNDGNFSHPKLARLNYIADRQLENVSPYNNPKKQRVTDTVQQSPIQSEGGALKEFTGRKPNLDSQLEKSSSFQTIVDHGHDLNIMYDGSQNLVAPKAKVDKTTQVIAKEITKETGWDLIERIYMALLNMKTERSKDSTPSQSTNQFCKNDLLSRKAEEINDSKKPIDPGTGQINLDLKPMAADLEGGIKRSQSRVTSSHGNVTAWFERNSRMMQTLRAPVHQFTIETVDSGFDDNPAHYNRAGRLSLPSLHPDNGHMRICRKPYRGPRLPLEPHLVNSASSQEVSLERRELGNEADDELRPVHNKISPQPIRRQKRKQRPKVKRESWSLSDSELNDRRKRMTRQHLMIQNSSAAINHNNENQYFGDSDANGPVAENSEFSFATDSKHPLEMTLPIANQNNQTSHSEFGTPEKSMPSICLSTQTYKSGLINKSTTDSVDSNYMSFGVSRPHRSDLLSHISDFQKLFPTNEETGDSFGDTNMTENINNHNQNNEIHDCTPTDTDTDRSNMEHVIENPSTQISYNYADVMEEFFIDLNNEESGRSISSHDNAALFEDGSPLYDMLSSSKMSDITANAHVARYGDVISVISHNGSPMVFRIAGAGLQCGTVGENISFQIWVENPGPGSLSVVVTGPSLHVVDRTSIVYTGDNVYEVSFTVTEQGVYYIQVKWGNKNVTQTPYMCEVTL